MSDLKSQQIAMETEKDACLQTVTENLNHGWPRGECRESYDIRARLSFVNGLSLRENRVPQSVRTEMLRRLHEGHLGMEKCKSQAGTAIYWSGIHANIDRMVSSCQTCLRHEAAQPKEPMAKIDLPDELGRTLGPTSLPWLEKIYIYWWLTMFENIQRWWNFPACLLHVLSDTWSEYLRDNEFLMWQWQWTLLWLQRVSEFSGRVWFLTLDFKSFAFPAKWKSWERSSHCQTVTQESSRQQIWLLSSPTELSYLTTRTW